MSVSTLTTYTYTKTIKNVTLLMSTIYNNFGKQVELYDYDIPTSTLTITFKNVLSDDDKLALDTLVNIYVDSTSLTPEDILSLRTLHVHKSKDQNMPNTLNTVVEVLFKSPLYIDREYYQMSNSGKYIYIQKPGIYLITVKVGASLVPGAVAGTNTIIQWGISYDDTRAEGFYISVPNTNVYTIHTNVNSMADTAMLTCVLNVTGTMGTYFRLTAKQTVGNTPLTIDMDLTNMTLLYIPGASFYEGNLTTALTLTTNYANVNLNSDRLIQYPFTHTVSTPNVTVNQRGYVLFMMKATTNKTTGTDQSNSRVRLMVNNTDVNLFMSSSPVAAASNRTTTNFIGCIPVNAGDIISMQAKINSGTSLQLPAAESGLLLTYLHPSVIRTISVGSFSANTSNALNVTPNDVPMSSTLSNFPVGNIALSTASVSILNAGSYLIFSNTTITNSSSGHRETGAYLVSTSDSGKTYYYGLGSLGIKQVFPNILTTVPSCSILTLPAGSTIKLSAATNGAITDNVTVSDSSTFTLLNFAPYQFSDKDVVFGDEFSVVTSLDELIVDSNTFNEKCRITYFGIPSGIYRMCTNVCFTTTAQTTISYQLLDVHTDSSNTYTLVTKTINLPIGTMYHMCVDFLNIPTGSHHLILQFSSPNLTPYICKDVTLDIWRIR